MTKIQKDLVKIVQKRKFQFADLLNYIQSFKKYNDLTYRDLDGIMAEATETNN